MSIAEREVFTSKGKVSYLETGNGDKTLLLFHGGMGSPWLIEHFSDINFRLIMPYLPGHGGTFNLTASTTYQDIVSTSCETIDEVAGSEKVYIGGMSFGGRIALDLSSIRQFNGAILISPVLNKIHTGPVRTLINIISDSIKDKRNGYVQKSRVDIKLPHYAEALWLWKILTTLDLPKTDLGNNVTFVMGTNDKVLPMGKNMDFLKKTNARLITFNGGHYYFRYNPDKLTARINTWIDEN